jgi:predicted DNA-binding transcriptional regulator YafY
MRAGRLLSIVLLLQSRGRLTARELARRLEVSERTILRDMDALSGAGIPVVAERGAGGGWSLLGEYRTDLTGFSEAEIQSLFVTRPARLLADLNLEQAAEGALLKLLAALPSTYRRGAEYVRQRIHLDATGWRQSEESAPLLRELQEAVWNERRLKLAYRRGECEEVERVADPLGLVAKGSVWYLVASVDGEPRSYRVSRILRAEPTGEPCERPQGFALAEFWQQSTARFGATLPCYRVVARVRREAVFRLPYAGRFARIEETGEPDAAGWVRVALRFDAEEMAVEYAMGFGPLFEVLEPAELREKVVAAARAVVASYERGAAGSAGA